MTARVPSLATMRPVADIDRLWTVSCSVLGCSGLGWAGLGWAGCFASLSRQCAHSDTEARCHVTLSVAHFFSSFFPLFSLSLSSLNVSKNTWPPPSFVRPLTSFFSSSRNKTPQVTFQNKKKQASRGGGGVFVVLFLFLLFLPFPSRWQ